jgi:heme/copper-type cytochrome/quinol oxidase subunit 3
VTDAALANDVIVHDDHGHPPTSTGISSEKLGMWIFLASECLLFGGLISTFLLYRTKTLPLAGEAHAEPLHEAFNIAFTSASSFVLLMSSLSMVLAVAAIHKGDIKTTRIWIGVTALLGMMFISGQVYEFYEFAKVEGFGFTQSPAWSAFFTLTGFHGAHVTIGIVMLMVTLALTFSGRVNADNPESVEIVGLYWHFVDVVWIIVFTVVYLIK